MTRLGVVGASGFVGQAILETAAATDHTVKPVRARVEDPEGIAASSEPAKWHSLFSTPYKALLRAFEDVDVVVNAAGIADPQVPATPSLYAANVVLPALVARAAHESAVARFLHVSTAAVQGRKDPLDEQAVWHPFSPYSSSKADAEKLLLGDEWTPAREKRSPAIVLYRATSVHGPDRPLTRRLARMASRPVVPVCRRGAVPLPVALWENLGAGIVHAATATDFDGIVLQPDEGITAAQLWRAFNPEIRFLNLPLFLVTPALTGIRSLGKVQPGAEAIGRRLELLLLGQRLHAEKLRASGFAFPSPAARWSHLGRRMSKEQEPRTS